MSGSLELEATAWAEARRRRFGGGGVEAEVWRRRLGGGGMEAGVWRRRHGGGGVEAEVGRPTFGCRCFMAEAACAESSLQNMMEKALAVWRNRCEDC